MNAPRIAQYIAAMSLVALVGCPTTPDFIECRDGESCFEGGQCLANPDTGHQFCAYEDPSCPSGMRWSDLDVEDPIAGMCVADGIEPDAGVPDADPNDPDRTLTVNVGGNGTGAVTSSPPGIDCPAVSCTGTFAVGATVQLTATPTAGVFLGWSDACSGSAGCSIDLDADTSVGALFGVAGEALWFDQVGSSAGDYASEVFFAGDHAYAGGWFQGTVTIGGQSLTSAGTNDAFVAKLDAATGDAVWAVRFGSTDLDSTAGIAVDTSGDVIVTGKFKGAVNFGGGALTSAGDSDIFVVKLAGATGAHVWSKRFGGTGNDGSGGAVVTSATGEVVVGGAYGSSSITFGGSALTNAGPGVGDLYLAKLANADGAHVWSKRMGGAASDTLTGLAIDASGDLVITGEFLGTTNLGGSDLVSAGSSDILLAKYGAALGAHLFSFRYGSTAADSGSDVAVDSARRILLTGSFQGTVSFGGPTPLTSVTGRDVFLVRYSLAGAHDWSKSFASTSTDYAGGVTVGATDDVTIIGSFSGTLNLGGDDLTSAGTGLEVFLGTFAAATGDHLGSVRQGGTGQENGVDVAEAPDGRLYCVGHFDGFAEFGGLGHLAEGGVDGFIVGLVRLAN